MNAPKTVRATQAILTGASNIANVSYTKDGQELSVIFSHSATNELGEFDVTTWDMIKSLCPDVHKLVFDSDRGILFYNPSEHCWETNAVAYEKRKHD